MEPNTPKENLGIIVHYKVKIRLIVAYGGYAFLFFVILKMKMISLRLQVLNMVIFPN